MAVEVYRGMGFVEVCRYIYLEPPEEPSADVAAKD